MNCSDDQRIVGGDIGNEKGFPSGLFLPLAFVPRETKKVKVVRLLGSSDTDDWPSGLEVSTGKVFHLLRQAATGGWTVETGGAHFTISAELARKLLVQPL